MTLEAAAGNTEVLAAMRKGAEALKRAVNVNDVDKVADVMDDINESMALADELGEAMSQSIGPQLDEDELNAELEQMESELNDEEMLKAPVGKQNRSQHSAGHSTALLRGLLHSVLFE
jgi:charged multivesicular body protein 4A/B